MLSWFHHFHYILPHDGMKDDVSPRHIVLRDVDHLSDRWNTCSNTSISLGHAKTYGNGLPVLHAGFHFTDDASGFVFANHIPPRSQATPEGLHDWLRS